MCSNFEIVIEILFPRRLSVCTQRKHTEYANTQLNCDVLEGLTQLCWMFGHFDPYHFYPYNFGPDWTFRPFLKKRGAASFVRDRSVFFEGPKCLDEGPKRPFQRELNGPLPLRSGTGRSVRFLSVASHIEHIFN